MSVKKPAKAQARPSCLLQRVKDTEYGVPARVWRVDGFGLDRANGQIVAQVAGYPNEAAVAKNSTPLAVGNVAVPYKGELDAVSGSVVCDLIRSLPEWKP